MLTQEDQEIAATILPIHQNASVILFVENPDKPDEDYHRCFSESLFVPDLAQARILLKKMEILGQFPDLIVLDIPISENSLTDFRNWMQATIDPYIPVIYNCSAIELKTAREWYAKKMIDDVVDVSKHYEQLPDKAEFLKKVGQANQKIKKPRKILNANCRFCFVKRALDVLVSSVAILICLPVLMLIAIAIKLESRGPVIYKSKRAGRGFKIFNFYKFRTMVVDADKKLAQLKESNQYGNTENGPAFFKLKDDPRITRLGKFLRNSSLDELPQLFNVLKGDMSIVGNRPLPLYEAVSLTTNEWAERFMAPAGITGLWQISKRGKEDMSSAERISLDISYARNRSLKGDLKIMLKTPTVLLQKSNV